MERIKISIFLSSKYPDRVGIYRSQLYKQHVTKFINNQHGSGVGDYFNASPDLM